jgi:nitroreductase
MTSISQNSLLESLRWRYATKRFNATKKIPSETWTTLESSLVLTPSSFGLQPWKFIVVQNADLRQRLSVAAWGQPQPIECSHFIVFLGKKNLGEAHVDKFLDRTATLRGVSKESLDGYRGMMVESLSKARDRGFLDSWQAHQVYIALGQFMVSAALLGVDACPMEGLDPAKFDEILGVDSTQWGTLCACAAGYRADDDKYASLPKVRFAAEDVISYR